MEISNSTTVGRPVSAAKPLLRHGTGQIYEPAIGPRLKILLGVIFGAVAILGATGVYLLAITILEKVKGLAYTSQFTLWMFLAHATVGVAIVVPFLVFGFTHLATAKNRPNKVAVRLGISLFLTSIVVGLTGLALILLEKLPQLPTGSIARTVVYWLHLLAPIAAVAFYVLHRRAGPDIKWSWGVAWGASVAAFVGVMAGLHSMNPHKWLAVGPKEGERYFQPSRVHTADGKFISETTLMMDSYCLKCHADVYQGWFHSAHHFSSFNNPPYLFSVRETRKVSLARDNKTQASRWCAGCHDPVPFLSGKFDDPNFDDVNDPTSQAGITCTVCHAITNVDSVIGNGAYTIEEPQHYPFAYSTNPLLQWLNNQLVKARPDFHKKTLLKPFHRSAEFCSVCHKVSIPVELTHYREFQRGQDHYNNFLLSGVSGGGARSFYYPAKAKTRCAECHMPLLESSDFGSKDFDQTGLRKVHDHMFPAADTGLAALLALDPKKAENRQAFESALEAEKRFLRGSDPEGKDRPLHIDLFGIKSGGRIDGGLTVLRPDLPKLKPGETYLVEVVLRTLNVGHIFPQGTADSNEIWVAFEARSGDRLIGRSGAMTGPDDSGKVDEWSHFVNALVLDRNGNRINRRNPQDIFTPLYDHQMPPGAGQVVHYKLTVPKDVKGPIELAARLRYRKFDHEYMSLVYKESGSVPKLPVIDMCEDRVVLPVEGVAGQVPAQTASGKPGWQRWNDYGIGCFLEGGAGNKKGELKQAEAAFQHLLTLPDKLAHGHGHLNLARVYFDEGRLSQAAKEIAAATTADPPAPWWVAAWFSGLIDEQNGNLERAAATFQKILNKDLAPAEKGFNFSRDFVVINELGTVLFHRARQIEDAAERGRLIEQAIARYERTLTIEPEDLDAHYGLNQCFTLLGEKAPSASGRPVARPVDPKHLLELAKLVADRTKTPEERLSALSELSGGVIEYGKEPTDPHAPKLQNLLAAIGSCRPAYDQETDPGLRAAIARTLGILYQQTHAIYKPDDNARDRAVRIYRAKHPAAAAASEAIVIYPLDR
jgi:tetratricopeptide (TPR) repeat protein